MKVTKARLTIESRIDTTDTMKDLAEQLIADAKEYRNVKVDGVVRRKDKAALVESLKYYVTELTSLLCDVANEGE